MTGPEIEVRISALLCHAIRWSVGWQCDPGVA